MSVTMLKPHEKTHQQSQNAQQMAPFIGSKGSKQSMLRYVERRIPKEERLPLESLRVGQRFDGLIINIKNFGMYIDIGSTQDGFAHVSDCSQTTFVDSLEKRYSAGQDISAWVKFVNVKDKKLGLQLYPVVQVPVSEQKLEWADLERGKLIKGVVTKTSQYGSYLNINGPTRAFMHRRKMLSNNRQRKLQSWDLAPVGSIHDCYIYQVDLERRRIEVTSFPPEVWERRFGTSLEDDLELDDLEDDEDDEEDEDYDDEGEEEDTEDEELGGSAIASNKRTVLQTLDDDWEENLELEEDETEEILSSEEVQKLTGRKLLIDELQSSEQPTNADDELSDDELEEEADDLSAEELFYELSSGRSFVTLANLKNWDYIRVLLKNGDLDNELLREMFQASGGINGRLQKADFNNFLELFEEALKDDDEDYDNEEDDDEEEFSVDGDEDDDLDLDLEEFSADDDENEVKTEFKAQKTTAYLLDDGAADVDTDSDVEIDDDDDIDFSDMEDDDTAAAWASNEQSSKLKQKKNDDNDDVSDLESIAGEIDNMIEEDAKEKLLLATGKSPNNLVDSIYKSLTRNRKTLTETDAIKWDYCRALVNEGIATDDQLLDVLRRLKGKAKTVSREIFGEFVEEVSQLELRGKSEAKQLEEFLGDEEKDATSDNDNDEESDDEFDPEEDRKLLTDVFQSLAKGRRFIKHRDLLEWDFVLDLLTYGVLSEEDLEQKVENYSTGTGRSRGMDLEGFDKFVNEMMLIHKDAGIWFEEEGSDDSGDDDDDHAEVPSPARSGLSSVQRSKMANDDKDSEEDEVDGEDSDVSGEDDDDDSIELDPAEIFDELSTDKKYVAYDALRNWDFVKSMIERKDFSKFQFENLLTNFEPKSKAKLDLEEFEMMLDEIMLLAGILPEEDYDDEDYDETAESQ